MTFEEYEIEMMTRMMGLISSTVQVCASATREALLTDVRVGRLTTDYVENLLQDIGLRTSQAINDAFQEGVKEGREQRDDTIYDPPRKLGIETSADEL
jgi:hypothetical protein